MTFVDWCLLLGGLAFVSALSSAYLKTLPLSEPMLYLLTGLAVGGLGIWSLDLVSNAHWLERITEGVVILSLFVGGLKLRLPPNHRAWRAAYRLALPAMVLCIAGIALLGYFVLGLTLATALLLGAILAPTDPVLADEFAVNDAKDHDQMRYGLSGEAGLNDGMAFPFVILGLLLIEHQGQWGGWVGQWALERLLWAVPAGLLLGFGLGYWSGRLLIWVRQRKGSSEVSSDLLLLALIGLSYGLAELIHAWGFLSVFAAGVGLRQLEVRISRKTQAAVSLPVAPPNPHDPADHLLQPQLHPEALENPKVASGLVLREVLGFGEALERFFVLGVVFVLGVMLAGGWDWRGVVLGLVLLVLVRPVAVLLTLWATPTTAVQRGLMGWFGIRGIGSLYYLCYAIGEGLGAVRAYELTQLTLNVVGLSILLHGVSAAPLKYGYEKSLEDKQSASAQSTFRPT